MKSPRSDVGSLIAKMRTQAFEYFQAYERTAKELERAKTEIDNLKKKHTDLISDLKIKNKSEIAELKNGYEIETDNLRKLYGGEKEEREVKYKDEIRELNIGYREKARGLERYRVAGLENEKNFHRADIEKAISDHKKKLESCNVAHEDALQSLKIGYELTISVNSKGCASKLKVYEISEKILKKRYEELIQSGIAQTKVFSRKYKRLCTCVYILTMFSLPQILILLGSLL